MVCAVFVINVRYGHNGLRHQHKRYQKIRKSAHDWRQGQTTDGLRHRRPRKKRCQTQHRLHDQKSLDTIIYKQISNARLSTHVPNIYYAEGYYSTCVQGMCAISLLKLAVILKLSLKRAFLVHQRCPPSRRKRARRII